MMPQGGVGGMSRAAKKRAKKKKKQNQAAESLVSWKNEQNNNYEESQESTSKKAKLNHDDAKSIAGQKVGKTEKSVPDRKPDPNILGDDDVESVDESSLHPLQASDSSPSLKGCQLRDILVLKTKEIGDGNLDEKQEELMKSLSSKQRASFLFRAMLDPITPEDFYKEYWEKKALFVPAKENSHRYDGFLSLKSIREMSKKVSLYYGRDVNVTKYKKDANGIKRRITLDKTPQNTGGDDEIDIRVNRTELWSNYEKGCTIRLLCPHKHSDNVHSLLSTLELEFGCMVGANAYLTPPNSSQGFAPHWDDIEAFCLQLEGQKRWKVYAPTFKLPRVSSEDFTQEDLKDMEPVLDVTAKPGDLLYMPRGWIHQACTLKGSEDHSLHLTVSAMQQWSWIDLLEMVVPNALDAAASDENSSSLRQGLPRGFLDYMGAMHDTSVDENLPDSLKGGGKGKGGEQNEESVEDARQKLLQEKFKEDAKKRIMKVAKRACEMLDAACDQMGKRFLSDRLPPALTAGELAGTNQDADGDEEDKDILPGTFCRLTRPGIARLVLEDDKAVVYHCLENSRVFHGKPLSPMEFETDDGPALEQLVTTVEPNWIRVNDLFHDTIEDKVAIAQSLFDEGILAVENEEDLA